MQIACGRVTAQVKQQFTRVPVKEVEYGWRRSERYSKKKKRQCFWLLSQKLIFCLQLLKSDIDK